MKRFRPNFKSPRDCAALLLALWALLCVTGELAGRFAFPRISRVYRRIEAERRGAVEAARSADRPQVLMIGNSLFEKGIDLSAMQAQLTDYDVRRFVISATSSLDWYYGLRRLFAEGGRPQIVVLGLSVRQLSMEQIEGDLSVHLLVRTADVPRLGRQLKKDNTAVSDLYFANLSGFYGSRTQFRKWLLATLMPDVETLGLVLSEKSSAPLATPGQVARAAKHLSALNDICIANGARFVFVIPPTVKFSDRQTVLELRQAGEQLGVTVLSPIQPGSLDARFYSDGIHLSNAGASKFTSLLSTELRQTFTDARSREGHRDHQVAHTLVAKSD